MDIDVHFFDVYDGFIIPAKLVSCFEKLPLSDVFSNTQTESCVQFIKKIVRNLWIFVIS
jgi:hypothetical protein